MQQFVFSLSLTANKSVNSRSSRLNRIQESHPACLCAIIAFLTLDEKQDDEEQPLARAKQLAVLDWTPIAKSQPLA